MVTGAAPKRPLVVRAFAAALDHARRGPLSLRERIVYVRPLDEPVDVAPARVEARYSFTPPLEPAADRMDYEFRAFVGEREAYRMRVSLDAVAIAPLVPDVDLPGRLVFFYDCLTHPDFRGQGLYPASLTAAMRTLAARGYQRAYIRVHRGNEASIAGIEKAGFRRCGRIVHAAVFGFPVGPWKKPEPSAAPRGEPA